MKFMKLLMLFIASVLILSWLFGCKKSVDIPIDLQQRPACGSVHCSAQPFPVCTGELVSYDGNIAYQYNVKGNKLTFHGDADGFTAIANGNNYMVYGTVDTSLHIVARHVYVITIPLQFIYESHTSMNLLAFLELNVTVDRRMQVTFTQKKLTVVCSHPPYLYRSI